MEFTFLLLRMYLRIAGTDPNISSPVVIIYVFEFLNLECPFLKIIHVTLIHSLFSSRKNRPNHKKREFKPRSLGNDVLLTPLFNIKNHAFTFDDAKKLKNCKKNTLRQKP